MLTRARPRRVLRRCAVASLLSLAAAPACREPFVMPQPELDRLAAEPERELQYERNRVVRSGNSVTGYHFATAATPDPPRRHTQYRPFFERYEETAALYQRALDAGHASIGLSSASIVLSTVYFLDKRLETPGTPGIFRPAGEIGLLLLDGGAYVAAIATAIVAQRSVAELGDRYNFNLRRELRLNEAKYWRRPPGVELSLSKGGVQLRF